MKTHHTSFSKKLTVLSFAGCMASALLPVSTALAAPPSTFRVSVSSTGEEGNSNSSSSYRPAFSVNGRFVVFQSLASNLVEGDNNGQQDIFVRDLKTGLTKRVSVDSAGAEGNGFSYSPSISANGRFVAFWSNASNLVEGDSDGSYDVFVHDIKTGMTERVSVDSAGAEGNGSANPSISANGRFVAFQSGASNLVEGDNNGTEDVFVRDLKTGVTKRVSVDSAGAEGNEFSLHPTISANGRFVVFQSLASNLVEGEDNNGEQDIFVRDLKTGLTKRVSVDSAGAESNNYSQDPVVSSDGRVAFWSIASNLVAGDNNNGPDIFVHDIKTGMTERVSVDSAGAEGNGFSYYPSISANGRFVAFQSGASNLVEGDNNGTGDVFVRDLKTSVTKRVSVDSAGAEVNGSSYGPSISANGRFVAFTSQSTNLVEGDYNAYDDVFVRRRW